MVKAEVSRQAGKLRKSEEKGMEETFAGLVAEVEKAVRPLGFRIERADYEDKTPLMGGNFKEDEGRLEITLIRKCNPNRFAWVGLSDTQHKEEKSE